jgi:hypothetical protein
VAPLARFRFSLFLPENRENNRENIFFSRFAAEFYPVNVEISAYYGNAPLLAGGKTGKDCGAIAINSSSGI